MVEFTSKLWTGSSNLSPYLTSVYNSAFVAFKSRFLPCPIFIIADRSLQLNCCRSPHHDEQWTLWSTLNIDICVWCYILILIIVLIMVINQSQGRNPWFCCCWRKKDLRTIDIFSFRIPLLTKPFHTLCLFYRRKLNKQSINNNESSKIKCSLNRTMLHESW